MRVCGLGFSCILYIFYIPVQFIVNMSELSEQQGMAEARQAQMFFREAVTCCMEKNHTSFIKMVDNYTCKAVMAC